MIDPSILNETDSRFVEPCPVCQREVKPLEDETGAVFLACSEHPGLGQAALDERGIEGMVGEWNGLADDWRLFADAACAECDRQGWDGTPRLTAREDVECPYVCSCECTKAFGVTWRKAFHGWKRETDEKHAAWERRRRAFTQADMVILRIEEMRSMIRVDGDAE